MNAASLPSLSPRTQSYLAFARLPDPATILSRGAYKLLGIIDRFRRSGNDSPTDDELARELGCSRGQVSRYLREAKETNVPGETHGFVEVTRRRGLRFLRLAYQLKPPAGARKQPSGPSFFRAPDLHGISAGADCNQRRRSMHADSLPLEGFRELENVNVNVLDPSEIRTSGEAERVDTAKATEPDSDGIGLPGPALAEAGDVTGAGRPSSAASAARPVDPSDGDGVDAELARLTDDELKALIARLSGSGRNADVERRFMARMLLAGRQGASGGSPKETPTAPGAFNPPRPKPVAPPAPKPPVPAPSPSVWTLADRLARGVAGPGPVEDLVKLLAKDLRDDHSDAQWRRIARMIRAKQLSPGEVASAYDRATGSKTIVNRAAVFTKYLFKLE